MIFKSLKHSKFSFLNLVKTLAHNSLEYNRRKNDSLKKIENKHIVISFSGFFRPIFPLNWAALLTLRLIKEIAQISLYFAKFFKEKLFYFSQLDVLMPWRRLIILSFTLCDKSAGEYLIFSIKIWYAGQIFSNQNINQSIMHDHPFTCSSRLSTT